MSEALELLLAEDNDGHAVLVERILDRAGIDAHVVRLADGQETLDYIFRRGIHADRAANGPMLLLLDINMPKVDGVEVLAQIKADKSTARTPVVMFTTTDDPREIERCYELGCNMYVTKPVAYDEFVESLNRLASLVQIAQIPAESVSA